MLFAKSIAISDSLITNKPTNMATRKVRKGWNAPRNNLYVTINGMADAGKGKLKLAVIAPAIAPVIAAMMTECAKTAPRLGIPVSAFETGGGFLSS